MFPIRIEKVLIQGELKGEVSMKTIGLIGGMTYLSSSEYYNNINKTVKEKLGGFHSAKCILYSVDFEEIEELQQQGQWDKLTKMMIHFAQKLEGAGADFIVICTNTMHKMAEEVQENINIPLLHIVDATAKKIIEMGLEKVGLLGTRFTMEGDFYKKRLKEKFNIDVVIPSEDDRGVVCNVIYDELSFGTITQSSKEQFKRIIRDLVSKGADGVILGCTEIPLLIKQEDVGVPLFDTTTIHSVSAAEFALK